MNEFYAGLDKLKKLQILNDDRLGKKGVYARDVGKIVISTRKTDKNGKWLYDILRNRYKLQPEMAAGNYVICMTSYMDSRDGFSRLLEALLELDDELDLSEKKVDIISSKSNIVCEDICNAMDRDRQERVKFSDGLERISGEFIYAYPPGIPIVVPGEMITEDIINIVNMYKKEGLNIQGSEDVEGSYIYVLK